MSNENASTSLQEFFKDPIYIYTLEQAIDDGVLVDVTDVASSLTRVESMCMLLRD